MDLEASEAETSDPDQKNIESAIGRLTSTEKEIIDEVLKRDDDIKAQEKERLRNLKKELDELVELGVPEGRQKDFGRICARCRTPLGLVTNRGALCHWCRKRVCRGCRKTLKSSEWICTLCHKEREIKAESGAWFYDSLPKKKRVQYGTTLLKKFVRRKKNSKHKLSKSRHKSDDELVASGELEYTVEQTFRPTVVDPEDKAYVVVDQGSDGHISVSEGNVASCIPDENEAAVVDNLFQGNEKEAALQDVYVGGNPFIENEPTSNETGDQEYDAFQGEDKYLKSNEGERVDDQVQSEDVGLEISALTSVEKGDTSFDCQITVHREASVTSLSAKNLANDLGKHDGDTNAERFSVKKGISQETSVCKNDVRDRDNNYERSVKIETEKAVVTDVKENVGLDVESCVPSDVEQVPTDDNANKIDSVAESSPINEEGAFESSNVSYEEMHANREKHLATDIAKSKEFGITNDFKNTFAKDTSGGMVSQTVRETAKENSYVTKQEVHGARESHLTKGIIDQEKSDMKSDLNNDVGDTSEIKVSNVAKEIRIESERGYSKRSARETTKGSWRATVEDVSVNAAKEIMEDARVDSKEAESTAVVTGAPNVRKSTSNMKHDYARDDSRGHSRGHKHEYARESAREHVRDREKDSILNRSLDAEKINNKNQSTTIKTSVNKPTSNATEQAAVAKSLTLTEVGKKTDVGEETVAPDESFESTSIAERIARFSKEEKSPKKEKSLPTHSKSGTVDVSVRKKEAENPNEAADAENDSSKIVSYDQETGRINGYSEREDVKTDDVDVDSIFDEYIRKEQGFQAQISAESYESFDSYQSDDVYEALRPQVKVAGEILLGLKYDESSGHFEIQVHKAKDLAAADTKKASSDPYVKTYLLQGKDRSNKKKTKVKKHTLNPVFDEILRYKIGYQELMLKTLSVSVWHNDSLGQNVLLGEVQIVIQDFINSGFVLQDPTPQLYKLTEKQPSQDTLKFVGEITIETMFIPPGGHAHKPSLSEDPVAGQLVVKCVEAKNLEGDDSTSPFCKLVLLPLKNGSKDPKHKTTVEAKTLNPYWDQEFIFNDVIFSELSGQVLQVSVHDAAKGNKRNFLGAVRLGLGTSDQAYDDPNMKESSAWQKLLQEPNKRINSTLSLRSTIESLKGAAVAPPILIEREEEIEHNVQVREFKSGSVLSQLSNASYEDSNILKTGSLKTRLKTQPDQYSLQSYGSLMSVYSEAGGYGSIPISGEMLFSIQYDDIAGVFEVHVQKAKNIAIANKKTKSSDPYVKTYLLPDKSKDSKKKTTFKKRTVNPNWDEKIKYKIGQKDLMKRTLQVSIWNHEKFGQNDFLGEAQVQMAQYVKSGHSLDVHEPIWYTLQEMAPVSVGGPGNKGSLILGLKFETIDGDIGKLLVEVKEAKDLTAADVNALSNPFVKSYLLPDRTRKSKRKSTFKKGTLNPKWNEKFEYSGVTLEELEHRVLELTVWDHEPQSNDFLGGTRVGLGRGDQHWHDSSGKEVSVWNAMLEHPGIWVEYSVPLRDSMTSRKGLDVNLPEIINAERPEPAVVKDGDGIASSVDISFSEPLIRVGLMFVSPDSVDDRKAKKGLLKVMLKGARNLPVAHGGISPSTYCKCFIRPRKNAWKSETSLYKRSVEPMWEKEITFEGLTHEELSSKGLDVIIYNESDKAIGMVRLGLGILQESWDDSTGREVEIWKAMMDNPSSWHNLIIPLRMNPAGNSPTVSDNDEAESITEKEVAVAIEEPKKAQVASPSAKAVALKSMGEDSAKVVDILKSNEATVEEDKKVKIKIRTQSQDNLDRVSRPLSVIGEAAEDNDTESIPAQLSADNNSSKTTHVRAEPVSHAPRIIVSKETEAGSDKVNRQEEEFEFEDEFSGTAPNSNLSKFSKYGSRESLTSMTSVYSGVSPIFGAIPVKGEIQFATKYDHGSSSFEIHIFSAKDIAAVDPKKNVSDPYVKCYLLPDKTKQSKKKTKVKYKTINPAWDEIVDYKISLVDLRTRVLMVTIWNFDRFGRNIFLGEVCMPMDERVDGGLLNEAHAEWYPLQEKSPFNSPTIYKGRLKIGLMFEDSSVSKEQKKSKEEKKKKNKKKSASSRIHVHVISAEDLPAGDVDGFSDPYCKMYLLPLRQAKTKRKTPVIKKARSANWDYRTEYDADFDDLPELGIEFTVYDWDKHSRNDFLGCARINLGGQNGKWDDALGVEREAWQAMIAEPNKWHEFVLPLRSSSDPRPKVDFD